MENERRGIRWLARTRRVVRRVVRYMVGSGDSVAVWQCGSVAAVAPVVIVIVNSNSNRNSSDSGSMTAVSTPTVNLARRRGFIRIPRPGCYDLIEWGSRDTPSPNPATMMEQTSSSSLPLQGYSFNHDTPCHRHLPSAGLVQHNGEETEFTLSPDQPLHHLIIRRSPHRSSPQPQGSLSINGP